jgi:hypothetical protein
VSKGGVAHPLVPQEAWPSKRPPLPFETRMPGVFAVGDVRHGSVKRVAGAVGEGSVAAGSVHRYLFETVAAFLLSTRMSVVWPAPTSSVSFRARSAGPDLAAPPAYLVRAIPAMGNANNGEVCRKDAILGA